MSIFTSESRIIECNQRETHSCNNIVTSAQYTIEREKYPTTNSPHKRCTNAHKIMKCQSQNNFKDIGSFRYKSLKIDQEYHKTMMYK